MIHRVLFTAAFAAVAIIAAPFAAQPAGAADAASVLAKHKAYMGWAYGDGTLKTARITAEPTSATSPAPTPDPAATPDPLGKANFKTVEIRRELLYKQTTKAYGLDYGSEGFTGSVFWRANENGNVVTRRLRDGREALTEDIIDAEAFAEVPASLRPDAPFDGKPANVVRLEPKTGVPADVYFDATTGAMLGCIFEPELAPERVTVHVVSYGEFAPGKRYVSAVRVNESKRVTKVTSFEANVPVSDADLHPPAATSTWTFGPPKPAPIEIVSHTSRYSDSGGRAVHVEVAVNGHVGHFLFDSGAGGMIMFDRFAKVVGAKELGRTGYSGVNGRGVAATIVRADTIAIGGSTLHNVLLTHGSTLGDTLDGIVGYDVLAAAIVNVNLVNKTITVSDPNGYEAPVPPGAYAFPLDLSIFHAGVPVKVNEVVLPSVWIDTGNDFFVILPHELEKKTIALPETVTIARRYVVEQTVYFGGVDGAGAEPARCVRLNQISVGPYRYQNALSCFAPNDTFGAEGGLIGFDFLRHFNWTFDYPHGKMVLTPNNL
ncbi:MAG TPA: retropepsin-like aspartic protease [Candidatus Elarobacter sp.]|jgi:predicted aspartyl protease